MISYGASSVHRTLEGAEDEVERYNGQLKPIHATIDEIALLVGDNSQHDQLDALLCRDFGWERFNTATDNVKTQPIRSGYSVEYTFYRHPNREWRLEVMRLTTGVSPLHAAVPLPLARAVCTPVHASFKCADEETYAVARYALGEMGYVEAQRCDSTYGRFSYFTTLGVTPCRVPYLKPRVNLRDASL
jgi:hypothetical protein